MLLNLRLLLAYSLALLANASWSQDDSAQVLNTKPICPAPLLQQDFEAVIHVQAFNADHAPISFRIIWTKHVGNQADTFRIMTSQQQWMFTSGTRIRTLIDLQNRAVRAMAMHHLREPILGTILRYDDLELAAKGLFLCPDTTTKSRQPEWIPAQSETWFKLVMNTMPPSEMTFYGYRKWTRQLQMEQWDSIPGIQRSFPARITMKSNERSLIMRVQSIQTQWNHSPTPFTNESWSPHLD